MGTFVVLTLQSINDYLMKGIWFLKKFNKSQCLAELSLTDTENPFDSFVFKLSQQKGFAYFKHVLLLASQQDKYAPFHSARVELHEMAFRDRKRGFFVFLFFFVGFFVVCLFVCFASCMYACMYVCVLLDNDI